MFAPILILQAIHEGRIPEVLLGVGTGAAICLIGVCDKTLAPETFDSLSQQLGHGLPISARHFPERAIRVGRDSDERPRGVLQCRPDGIP